MLGKRWRIRGFTYMSTGNIPCPVSWLELYDCCYEIKLALVSLSFPPLSSLHSHLLYIPDPPPRFIPLFYFLHFLAPLFQYLKAMLREVISVSCVEIIFMRLRHNRTGDALPEMSRTKIFAEIHWFFSIFALIRFFLRFWVIYRRYRNTRWFQTELICDQAL